MDQKQFVLVVEDEAAIREGLTDFLDYYEFEVTTVEDGLQAERIVAEHSFDLIILDLMLPKISGEQLCRQWRQQGLQTPIIMVTAKGQEKERISGLDMGADDYVTKPFSLEELLARVRAVLRRLDPTRSVGQTFTFGDLTIDAGSLKATREHEEISLSHRECGLIQYFAAHPHRIINRQELFEKVWHDLMTDLGTRTVDMHIAKLRSKIEKDSAHPDIIKTVRGAGYCYEPAS